MSPRSGGKNGLFEILETGVLSDSGLSEQGEIMTDSKQWALEKMEQANQIFEPNEVKPKIQLMELVFWTIEICLIACLAFRLYLFQW